MLAVRLRSARQAAGLSQAGLAAAAGLSRQAVGAIEAGRHRPSVDAAIALARVLGVTVEDVFSSASDAVPVHPAWPVAEGDGVLAARVGASLVYAPAGRALAFEGWPPCNAVLRDGRPEPLPGGDVEGLMVMGCDPALGVTASLLAAAGPRGLHAVSGSTADALEAMRGGRVHGALVHDRADRLPDAPQGALCVHLARWRVGVAARGGRALTVGELCARRIRVVQREDGASTQKAFLSAAAAAGATAPPGPRAASHVEVARRVHDGAPAGVTMEPAARAFGLRFAALEEHSVELWIAAAHRDHPAVEPLVGALRSRALTDRLALVGAYDTSSCGSPIGVR